MSISDLRRWARVVGNRARRTARSYARPQLLATPESLEKRRALSAMPLVAPAIQMISATTTDSKSVTIDYRVNQSPSTTNPIQFGQPVVEHGTHICRVCEAIDLLFKERGKLRVQLLVEEDLIHTTTSPKGVGPRPLPACLWDSSGQASPG